MSEILKRIEETKDDFLPFRREVLVYALDFASAKPFLKPEATADGWPVTTDTSIKKEALEYLVFAWGKVRDHRGISAQRSVQKLLEWVWLLGDESLFESAKAARFAQYGAPILAVISKAWGASMPDDAATLRMIAGEPCVPECGEGCGT
jgi:hypothetical protein